MLFIGIVVCLSSRELNNLSPLIVRHLPIAGSLAGTTLDTLATSKTAAHALHGAIEAKAAAHAAAHALHMAIGANAAANAAKAAKATGVDRAALSFSQWSGCRRILHCLRVIVSGSRENRPDGLGHAARNIIDTVIGISKFLREDRKSGDLRHGNDC